MQPSQVDRVIRVGGSSRIPCMMDLLQRLLGTDRVWGNTNPSLAVSQGAAVCRLSGRPQRTRDGY
ncbi:MAG: Hsp70 family protein [Candidatus Competibacteraceae bacterium]